MALAVIGRRYAISAQCGRNALTINLRKRATVYRKFWSRTRLCRSDSGA